jgi:hypothetical protein
MVLGSVEARLVGQALVLVPAQAQALALASLRRAAAVQAPALGPRLPASP